MSVRVMADVWDAGPEDAVGLSVLVALANHCDDDGRSCFPSVERIARMVRRSQRTVERSIAALEADGWIEVERGGGRGVFSSYAVNAEMLAERAAAVRLERNSNRSKGRQSVAVLCVEKVQNPRAEKATPGHEKATATTERATATASYKEEPSCNHQENKNTPLPPSQARGDVRVSGSGWSVETLEAAGAVMRECGSTNARLREAIGDALQARCNAGYVLREARELAVDAVGEYKRCAPKLRYTWSWTKFFRDGYWADDLMWPFHPGCSRPSDAKRMAGRADAERRRAESARQEQLAFWREAREDNRPIWKTADPWIVRALAEEDALGVT